jgi:hypothetical protein
MKFSTSKVSNNMLEYENRGPRGSYVKSRGTPIVERSSLRGKKVDAMRIINQNKFLDA